MAISKEQKGNMNMAVKNEAKIKNPLIVAIREQLEHRALWMYDVEYLSLVLCIYPA